MSKPPKFVKLKSSALRYRKDHDDYWRDGGHWYVKYKYDNGILYSDSDTFHLDMEHMVEITEEEWREDNYPYLPTQEQLKEETYD